MDKNKREARGTGWLRLPVAMTEHATTVGGIDHDRLGNTGQIKGRTRKEVAHDGLQMAI